MEGAVFPIRKLIRPGVSMPSLWKMSLLSAAWTASWMNQNSPSFSWNSVTLLQKALYSKVTCSDTRCLRYVDQ